MTSPPPLAELTTLRLGGPPTWLIRAETEDQLVAVVRAADRSREPLVLLGHGSNVVAADAGVAGIAVQVATRGVRISELPGDRVRLDVAAGENWDDLVGTCVRLGLSGIEAMSGIPGTVGATPIQNVGAYGQEVRDVITHIRTWDRREGAIRIISADDCAFASRSSVFKAQPDRWVVLEVSLVLMRSDVSRPLVHPQPASRLDVAVGDVVPLADARDAVIAIRRSKGFVIDNTDPDTVSAGSFFMNPIISRRAFTSLTTRIALRHGAGTMPPWEDVTARHVKVSAAWLIEHAGFTRGQGDPDGIAISSKHVLALTNRGGGTTERLVAMARSIVGGVRNAYGVELVPEPVFLGHDWVSPP